MVWHHSLPLMNSFNKTEAAVFSCRLCLLRAFPFISLLWMRNFFYLDVDLLLYNLTSELRLTLTYVLIYKYHIFQCVIERNVHPRQVMSTEALKNLDCAFSFGKQTREAIQIDWLKLGSRYSTHAGRIVMSSGRIGKVKRVTLQIVSMWRHITLYSKLITWGIIIQNVVFYNVNPTSF